MSRVQLALNVADLEASVVFYSTLFGTGPHKRRPGYANFAIADPPLKLVLIEVPASDRSAGTTGALNHLGVEVESSGLVDASAARMRDAGLATFEEKDTTCCYARQDKVWVHDPAGAPWEIYTVTDDDPDQAPGGGHDLPVLQESMNQGGCCASTPGSTRLDPASACC